MQEEVFTIQTLADFLQIDEKTVYRMAQGGELPSFKVRRQWRFKRADIDFWIESRKQRVTTQSREAKELGRGERQPLSRHGTRGAGPKLEGDE